MTHVVITIGGQPTINNMVTAVINARIEKSIAIIQHVVYFLCKPINYIIIFYSVVFFTLTDFII